MSDQLRIVPFPNTGPQTVHKNISEAIGDLNGHLREIRSDTRERKLWAYILTDKSLDECVAHFQRPEGTPVRTDNSDAPRRMVAVWMGDEPEPTTEPDF